MICGHCGHLNEDEVRCVHCGRRLDEPRHRSQSGDSYGGAAAAPWRQELHRRLDAYRQRRDGALAAAAKREGSDTTAGPNVISIERGARFPDRGPVAGTDNDRFESAPAGTWLELHAAEVASNGGAPVGPEAVSVAAAAANIQPDHLFPPPVGMGIPRPAEVVAVEAAVEPRSATPNEVRCSATVAPLPIRFFAGMLDTALLIIALGAFWGVFHWMGGVISADREGARAIGVTAFLVTGFYWAFYVGYFGETPGMTWLGLRLLSFRGRRANGRQRAARALGLLFSTTTFGMGFVWALLDDEKLTWHDRMSKTFVSRDGAVGFRTRSRPAGARSLSPISRKQGA